MVLFKGKKWDMNDLWSGYVEQHKSNRVIKRKKINYKTCDVRGLTPNIIRKLLNGELD